MNPYLSNTMPELTEHEARSLGSYTITHYDPNINHEVATKGSYYLFFCLAGITTEQDKIAALDLMHQKGKVSVITDTYKTVTLFRDIGA